MFDEKPLGDSGRLDKSTSESNLNTTSNPQQLHDVFSTSSNTIQELRNVLNDTFWEKSFLLKHKKKKIQEALQELEDSMTLLEDNVVNVDNVIAKKRKTQAIPEGDVLVYITLYQASGKDLMMWQITCNAISTCGFGRPIYLEEKDAKQLITSKGEKVSDGYVTAHVPQQAIINLDKDETEMFDSLNNKIIHIKPGYLSPEKIVNFIHYNHDKYFFIDGKLLLEDGT